MRMSENSKEIQVVGQEQAAVDTRRAWTRPEIYKATNASNSALSSHANSDGGLQS